MKKLFAIIALVLTTGAHAEFFSGNDLLERLDSDNYQKQSLGLGYIMGVFDTAQGIEHCAAPGITSGQARDVVRQYLLALPAIRHYAADIHVRVALARAWPCPKKSSGSGV